MDLFHTACAELGILHTPEDCFRYMNTFPEDDSQMSLFET